MDAWIKSGNDRHPRLHSRGGRSYSIARASGAPRQFSSLPEFRMNTIAKLALATLAALGASEASAQKLTFTLNWVAGGDHAPYFYAQKMGFYKQAGLDVDFETGRGSAASAQKVGAGQSQLGLSDMAGVLLFRGKGVGAVGRMDLYAHSP